MTARFKDFGAGGVANTEPLSFKLHEQDFKCRPSIQGKVLLDMVASASTIDGAGAALIIPTFFAKVLEEESFARFTILLDDPNKIVSVEALGEITSWLLEQYASRPTQGSEDSQSGQQHSGPTLTEEP